MGENTLTLYHYSSYFYNTKNTKSPYKTNNHSENPGTALQDFFVIKMLDLQIN